MKVVSDSSLLVRDRRPGDVRRERRSPRSLPLVGFFSHEREYSRDDRGATREPAAEPDAAGLPADYGPRRSPCRPTSRSSATRSKASRRSKTLSQRIDETTTAGEAIGAKFVGYYLTMGQYDAVAISEAPDDHTIAKLALAAGARGNVRTETLRAFTEEEARSIAGELSES